VGPFGPTEIEFREYESPSHAGRKWLLRIAARPEFVALALASDSPAMPRDLEQPVQVKWAVAFKLRALVSSVGSIKIEVASTRSRG